MSVIPSEARDLLSLLRQLHEAPFTVATSSATSYLTTRR
jgi:hypothetical protein